MATTTTTKISSVEDLMALATDQPWEVWAGELREVPGAGQDASAIAQWIGALIALFVKPRNIGVVTGADGSYILSHNPLVVVVPDVGFLRWERLMSASRVSGYVPVPPDLAIEVRSPSDRDRDIEEKVRLYRAAGTPLLWWVDPRRRTVAVYRLGTLVAVLGEGTVLDGEDIIPGFTVPVSEIFS